jgi:hypothetical protein
MGGWPVGEHFDPELLAQGDRRNVVDRYRYWRMEAIVADLDTRRHGFHVAIENWQHDMNIGSIVRSATRSSPTPCTSSEAALEPTRRHGHRSLSARRASRHRAGVHRVG